jgi:hypothetical protein
MIFDTSHLIRFGLFELPLLARVINSLPAVIQQLQLAYQPDRLAIYCLAQPLDRIGYRRFGIVRGLE